MRTTLDIDADLLRALVSRHPGLSKTQAIEEAIRTYLAADASEGLRALAGRVEIDDLTDLRRTAHR